VHQPHALGAKSFHRRGVFMSGAFYPSDLT